MSPSEVAKVRDEHVKKEGSDVVPADWNCLDCGCSVPPMLLSDGTVYCSHVFAVPPRVLSK